MSPMPAPACFTVNDVHYKSGGEGDFGRVYCTLTIWFFVLAVKSSMQNHQQVQGGLYYRCSCGQPVCSLSPGLLVKGMQPNRGVDELSLGGGGGGGPMEALV